MFPATIADTHVHLWDPARLRYRWLDGSAPLNRPFLLPDYAAATAGLPVTRMVFVQCECRPDQALAEAAWVTELAATEPRLQGLVAYAPLELGDAARPTLEQLAASPLVKGVRRLQQAEPDPAFCLRPDFVRGVQALADYGLSCDLCLKGDEQLAHTLTLVRQCPQVRFMLDHIGKPFIKERRREPWAGYVRQLAALPNTWCKVSGLVTEADWAAWTPADLAPYLETVAAAFGPDRLCFGGDWPVCTLASPYRRWAETLAGATAAWPAAHRQRLWHDNALAFYRLTP
jgi:L-fuconolactonase